MYAPFLMLDELGSTTRHDVYAEDMITFVYKLLDHRLAKRLPTLITTNLTDEELAAQYGQAVLCHGCTACVISFRWLARICDGHHPMRKRSFRCTARTFAAVFLERSDQWATGEMWKPGWNLTGW